MCSTRRPCCHGTTKWFFPSSLTEKPIVHFDGPWIICLFFRTWLFRESKKKKEKTTSFFSTFLNHFFPGILESKSPSFFVWFVCVFVSSLVFFSFSLSLGTLFFVSLRGHGEKHWDAFNGKYLWGKHSFPGFLSLSNILHYGCEKNVDRETSFFCQYLLPMLRYIARPERERPKIMFGTEKKGKNVIGALPFLSFSLISFFLSWCSVGMSVVQMHRAHPSALDCILRDNREDVCTRAHGIVSFFWRICSNCLAIGVLNEIKMGCVQYVCSVSQISSINNI